jgi:arabinose-5-phosphate isomerase
LYLRVADLYINNQAPKVQLSDSIKTIILEISSKRLGATAVLDHGQLKGIITDGDLRRMLEKTTDFEKITAGDIMTISPKTVDPNTLVVTALSIMRKNNITQLLVTDKDRYLGVLHLHDILKEGII